MMNLQDRIMIMQEQFALMIKKILTRDKRTTSHRVPDSAVQSYAPSTSTILSLQQTKYQDDASANSSDIETTPLTTERNNHAQRHLLCISHLVPAFYDDRGIRSRYKASIISQLSLGYILVALLLSSVHASPIMNFQGRRSSSTPKWVNPCGLVAENFDDENLDVVQLKDEQLLQQVVIQAKTALMNAQLFRDDFIRHTFKTDFEDLQATWAGQRYNWLPGPEEIPKKLGEKLSQEYLESLELDTALTDAYEYMQKYAVGLEQIVWDQEDYHLEFRKKFKDTEFKLRTVLCELQIALVERGVTRRQDITRDIMSPEFRTMPSSTAHRELRDWLIFRDYMNGLEYVVQVFEYLLKRARQERDPMEA